MFMDHSDADFGDIKPYHSNSNQGSSGLLRFRSAPSSLFAIFTDELDKTGHAHSSPEFSQGLNSGFISASHDVHVSEGPKSMDLGSNTFATVNSQLPPQYPRQTATAQLGSTNGGYRVVSNSMGLDQGQAKMGLNLMRQNSSPPGVFSHLASQDGYNMLRGYRVTNGANGELNQSSSSRLKNMTFSSGFPSSLGMLSRINEIENENPMIISSDEKHGNRTADDQYLGSTYSYGSWNEPSNLAEDINVVRREVETDRKLLPNSRGLELGSRTPLLSHHLSLPKTSAEIAAMEKLLQFQDTVPCKTRAKRGCATHPRSIAERVRRTRISERMRKLQELVPNMEKQTNTADMLDLAVDYIKDLQKQYKILSDQRMNCKCSSSMQNRIMI